MNYGYKIDRCSGPRYKSYKGDEIFIGTIKDPRRTNLIFYEDVDIYIAKDESYWIHFAGTLALHQTSFENNNEWADWFWSGFLILLEMYRQENHDPSISPNA